MKIMILGTAYPYRGGLAAYNERLAREFQSGGHEVEIITFSLQYPSFLFPGKTQFSESEAPGDLKITRLMNSVNPLNWLKVGRMLRKRNPDLLIIKFWLPFMAPCLGTIARIIAGNGHTKVISILDNIIPHEKRIGDRLFASYFVRAVDGFIAMSKSVLADVETFDSKKPKVFSPHPLYDNFGVPVGRDEAVLNLGLDPEFRYILFFGIIRDYKGLDVLLKAFSDKRIDKSGMKLLVAGEYYNNGEQYAVLEKELGLEGSIEWHTHFIQDEQVSLYFSAADVVVQPYKSATQSGVTQIAYHFEKPMIVTDVGGLAEIVPDGKVGYVVKPEPEAVADGIVKFFDGDTGRFAEGIKEEKQKYSWRRMVKTVIGLKETIEARRCCPKKENC